MLSIIATSFWQCKNKNLLENKKPGQTLLKEKFLVYNYRAVYISKFWQCFLDMNCEWNNIKIYCRGWVSPEHNEHYHCSNNRKTVVLPTLVEFTSIPFQCKEAFQKAKEMSGLFCTVIFSNGGRIVPNT